MRKFRNDIASAVLFLCLLPLNVRAETLLVPVGRVVGLELANDTVTVAGFDRTLSRAAEEGGLEAGDLIQRIDGKAVRSGEDVHRALARSHGYVEVDILRNGKPRTLRLTPEITPDGPRLGVYLRQGVTGIGTITWYDPETGAFGTLGHGVNDPQGRLLAMTHGSAYPARVVSVKKGKSGKPGQLVGILEAKEAIGALSENTAQGVFGSSGHSLPGIAVPVGKSGEIHPGTAVILSTVQGAEPREYSVEILKIYPESKSTGRNLLLRVTDPALLEATGGIVQGMSGSPILQDGKLIGAVTHVLVNSPDTGYGIFIENMLDAAS